MPEPKVQSTRKGSKGGHKNGSGSSSKQSDGNNAAAKPREQEKRKENARAGNKVTAKKNTNDNESDTDSSGYPTDYRDPGHGHSRINHAKSNSKNVKYSPAKFDALFRELEVSRICMGKMFADPGRAAEKRSNEASWLEQWGDQFMNSQHNFMNELASTPPEHIPHIFKELHHNIFRTLPRKLRGAVLKCSGRLNIRT
jgi:hypothetical protein